jgi:hypothetical protein
LPTEKRFVAPRVEIKKTAPCFHFAIAEVAEREPGHQVLQCVDARRAAAPYYSANRKTEMMA